jgi:hypothetical protein
MKAAAWVLPVSCAMALSCGTSRSPGAGAPAAAPGTSGKFEKGDVEAMAARERPAMSRQPVVFSDGRLSGDVEAAAPPTLQRQNGFWQIDVPIGTRAPVTCFVYDEVIDGAGSISKFTKSLRASAQNLNVKAIVPTGAGAVGEDGYMTALITHTTRVPAGVLSGQLKMLVRPDTDAPMLCFHDEVGYAETFKRVTLGLALALKAKKPHPAPQYVEIHVARVGDVFVGFDRRTIENDAHGKKIDVTHSSMLIPVSVDQLNAEDHVDIEFSDAAGRVTHVENIEGEAGEITTHVKMSRSGNGRDYSVTGKHSGKDISGAFKCKEKEGLASQMLVAARLRDGLLSGKARELKVEEYHGGLSPLAPVDVTYRAGAKRGDMTFFMGALEATGHVDARGMQDSFSLPVGSLVLRLERVLARGTP